MGVRTRIRQLHKDQKGFTLLEVLIAMFILAIIAVPLCRVYVSAANANAKARKQAGATAVAENIMEGINAFSYEDVIGMLESKIANSSEQILICPTALECVGGVEDDDKGSAVYVLRGVHEDVYDFDVRVTIDPSVYAGTNESGDLKVNEYELVSMSGYNSEKDYLYVLSEQSVVDRFGSSDYPGIKDQINRKIQIRVERYDTGDDQGIYVTLRIGYGQGAENPDDDLVVYGSGTFTGEDTLRSVYLCYAPNYATAGRDEIEIINEENVEFDLYLIKQECSATWSGLAVRENSYQPKITIKEGLWTAEDQGSYITIYNNYGTNLATGSDISAVHAEYTYSYRVESGNRSVTGNAANSDLTQVLHVGDSALRTEKRFVMFLVTIEVYEEGAFEDESDLSVSATPRVAVISNQ